MLEITARLTGTCRFWTLAMLAGIGLLGCAPQLPPTDGTDTPDVEAQYLGPATCAACHPNIAQAHSNSGHAHILKRIQGAPPQYPAASPDAGVPQPPANTEWTQINRVVGGFAKAANFIDREGHLLTDGAGNLIQYNVPQLRSGIVAGFTPTDTPADRVPYRFDCFRCHTTNPQPESAVGGRQQENLPGVGGTWEQDGVQCEACHGPGGNHPADPAGSTIAVGSGAICTNCHSGFGDGGQIQAADGFIVGNQQALEVAASPHAGLGCTVCHDPHGSVLSGENTGIRNACGACHSSQTMALHQDKFFAQGDYVERVTCVSCHMPLASRYANSAPPGFAGTNGRVGDTRTHLFAINTVRSEFPAMFTADGTAVATDSAGQAAVTVDFVCLRCHHGQGNVFELTPNAARTIASGIHQVQSRPTVPVTSGGVRRFEWWELGF